MRNTNKKGFTIVELVVVVAVIAILAAVLIPVFNGVIRKANIASDTAVAKNLNVAAISAEADTFDEAIAAVKAAGYYLANLNAKADECYFAWDDENNQFILVDGKDNYKVIYSNSTPSASSNWQFAISDATLAKKVADAGYNVKKTLASVADLKDAIAAGGVVYIDESVALNNENTIKAENGETVLELGSSALTASETIEGQPIASTGTNTSLIVNGGNISAAGSSLSQINNQVYNMIGKASNKSTLELNNTKIDIKTNLAFNSSNATLNFTNVETKLSTGTFIEASFGSKVMFKDSKIDISTEDGLGYFVAFLSNAGNKDGESVTGQDAYNSFGATTEVVFDGGEYTSYWIAGLYRGTLTIKDGKFNFVNHTTKATGTTIGGVENVEYFRFYETSSANIVIEGGTFNGVNYWDISDEDWVKVCRNNTGKELVINRDDATKIITISIAQ